LSRNLYAEYIKLNDVQFVKKKLPNFKPQNYKKYVYLISYKRAKPTASVFIRILNIHLEIFTLVVRWVVKSEQKRIKAIHLYKRRKLNNPRSHTMRKKTLHKI